MKQNGESTGNEIEMKLSLYGFIWGLVVILFVPVIYLKAIRVILTF